MGFETLVRGKSIYIYVPQYYELFDRVGFFTLKLNRDIFICLHGPVLFWTPRNCKNAGIGQREWWWPATTGDVKLYIAIYVKYGEFVSA